MKDNVYWIDPNGIDRFEKMKIVRINAIREMLKKLKKVSLKEFIAKVSINCGIHKRTLRSYLDDLETIGEITIKDGTIIYNEVS